MIFGEKLFKLRKEKGFSQEDLAEKLNTTRQAISKWENGQGYPETEKLLMIGNIFGVSMDYLLKDTIEISNKSEDGYYVSKEMAEGYLLTMRKIAQYVGLGMFMLVLSSLPYFLFEGNPEIYIIPTILLATLGIGMFVSAGFLEEEQYKILKREPLQFDRKYLGNLSLRYEGLKKKYRFIIVIGACFLVAGILTISIEMNYIHSGMLESYLPFCIGLIAIGLYMLIRTSIILEGYKLLAQNEEYTNRILFKLRQRVRKIIDEF